MIFCLPTVRTLHGFCYVDSVAGVIARELASLAGEMLYFTLAAWPGKLVPPQLFRMLLPPWHEPL